MPPALTTLAWRTALCAAVAWLGWRHSGPRSIALTLPLFAIAVAHPLLETMVDAVRALRGRVLSDLEGRHYVFRGIYVRVIEDEALQRWTRAADVRRIAGTEDSDHALALAHGAGYQIKGRPPEGYFNEAALLAHLARQHDARAWRLRRWAEHVIVGPARERRRRLPAGTAGADASSH